MENYIRKTKSAWFHLSVVIILTLFSSEIFADCCNECGCYAEVEALIWKTMHNPIFVARRFDSGTGAPRQRDELYLTGEYDPGVRVRFGYQTCDWFADISYLYFFNTEKVHKDRGDFDEMILAGGRPNNNARVINAKSTATFRYQNVDGRLGYCLCQGNNFSSFVYGNARWVKIDFKNHTQGQNADNPGFEDFLKQDSHFNGAGLGIGLGGRFYGCYGLGISANLGVMAIIGETELKNYSSASFDDTSSSVFANFISNPQRWSHILPALDFKIALDYAFCCCSYWLKLEFGYELNQYFNVLRYASENLAPPQFSAETPLFTTQDIGFAGPYVGVTVKF